MIEGARRLPTQHISIRVPWHDSGWSGHVCANPLGNTHCIALPRIGDTRDDAWEASVKGELSTQKVAVFQLAPPNAAHLWRISHTNAASRTHTRRATTRSTLTFARPPIATLRVRPPPCRSPG